MIEIIIFNHSAQGQNGSFFMDSSTDGYYETGLAFATAPSSITQVNTDKIPTSNEIVGQGSNSLKISWQSEVNGDWSAFIIAPGWLLQDISTKDTLIFNAYSEAVISASDLPYIFMEGSSDNIKSNKYDLAEYLVDGLESSVWRLVKIPLSDFFDDPSQTAIDFSEIKAIVLGQKNADQQLHTLYIDQVAAVEGDLSNSPNTPQGLITSGYELHTELRWDNDSDINPVNIFRSEKGLELFEKVGSTTDTIYIDFVGLEGRNSTFEYKLQRESYAGIESGYSELIQTSTFEMTDEELLDMIQEYTFRYFWEFAHPESGMAYERNTSVGDEIVTSGGSGFGLMIILVGIERGFISRAQGLERLTKIIGFLEDADRFHGAWSHWINGSTGQAMAFGPDDDGGDLVETSFVAQGLLTVREYLNENENSEKELKDRITALWESIEWNWYRQTENDDRLTWHWSPIHKFNKNFRFTGWNETMITYLLAISSPTHSVPAEMYDSGWANHGQMLNGQTFYDIDLPLGHTLGGPLFFTHYSFLGFNPSGLWDSYVNYEEHNKAQTLINRAYCIANPQNFKGYSENCWGLTASDDPDGYLAHEPGNANDNGTITPTAALSSFPFTPEESMAAFRHFYEHHGENLWGPMGFYDAFNEERDWYADSYLAIDQGPIVIMIENYRSGLLWNYFMASDEIKDGLSAIGFKDVLTDVSESDVDQIIQIYPNPVRDKVTISIDPENNIQVELFTLGGSKISPEPLKLREGSNEIEIDTESLTPGVYMIQIRSNKNYKVSKLIID